MTNPLDIGSGAQPTLHILQGALQGKSIPLKAPVMTLGREDGDIDLSRYVQMSRLHSRIFVENGVWSVQDLDSTNGTHINGERVASRLLQDGDVLQMGDFSARVSLPQSTSPSIMTQVVPPVAPPQQQYPQAASATPWLPQPTPQAYPPPYQAPPPAPYPPPPNYQVNSYHIAPPLKNPGLAAVLSFFYTGLGQFYNGEMNKGIAYLLGGIISTILMFFCIGFFIYPIVWILGIVDAYQSAERINYEAQINLHQPPHS